MNNLYNDIFQEHNDIDPKQLKSFLKFFKKPSVKYDKSFKISLDKKLSKKIQEKKETSNNQILNTVPTFVKWRYRMTGFVTAICAFLFIFILSFFSDFFGNELDIPHTYTYLDQEAFSLSNTSLSESDVSLDFSEDVSLDSLSSFKTTLSSPLLTLGTQESGATSQDFYRFLYDWKKYPKISSSLPVYKRWDVLLSKTTLSSTLSTLKFWNLSLKKFPDLTFSTLQLVSQEDEWYRLFVDVQDARYSIYDSQILAEIDSWTFSEKEIKKMIEKKMKSLGISLEGYGSLEIKSSHDGTYQLFYPQMLNGSLIYDPLYNEDTPLGIEWTYTPATDQLSLMRVDIAGYEVSHYPTISKEEVMEKIVTGGDFFTGGSRSEYAIGIKTSTPELVYLLSTIGGGQYYIPALRFTIDSSLLSTSVFYVQLVIF